MRMWFEERTFWSALTGRLYRMVYRSGHPGSKKNFYKEVKKRRKRKEMAEKSRRMNFIRNGG